MIDFTNPDEGEVVIPEENKTDFSKGGGTNQGENNQGDDSVLLEHEGRKYTKDDLIKKLKSSDEFIETLKSERAEDRKLFQSVEEQLKEQVNIREVLDQIKKESKVTEENNDAQEKTPVDVKSIVSQVRQELEQESLKKQQDSNWDSVIGQLGDKYGEEVNQKVSEVASENGLSMEEAAELARTRPKIFLKLFPELATKPAPKDAFSKGNVNTQAVGGNGNKGESPKLHEVKSTKERIAIYQARLAELGSG